MRNPRTKSDKVLIVFLIIFIALFVRSLAAAFLASYQKPLPPAQVNTVYTASSSLAQIVPATPVRIRIPSINVDANIQSLGKNAKGEMDTPKGDNRYSEAGWFNLGPKPGEIGSAVIDGHLDTYNLLSPGVFHDLDNLTMGDIVEVVDAEGTLFRFKVINKAELASDADASAVFGSSDKARLNLITCSGDWQQSQRQYDKRLVVFTELIQ